MKAGTAGSMGAVVPTHGPSLWQRGNRRPARRLARAALLLLLACAGHPPRAPADPAIWDLWTRHLDGAAGHARMAEDLLAFADAHAAGLPLAPVARTLAAWHLLKLDRRAEAREILLRHADGTGGGIVRGARELAQAWLTRLDREDVIRALDFYRTREVQYPETMAELAAWPRLPEGLHIPSRDRFGDLWVYRRERLRSMPGLAGQRFSLQSRRLGETSDLGAALDIPYASRIPFEPRRVLGGAGRPVLQLARTDTDGAGGMFAATVGEEIDGILVVHVGQRLVLLADRLHWKIARRPAANEAAP